MAKDRSPPARQTPTTLAETVRDRGSELELWQSRRPEDGPASARASLKGLHDEMIGAVLRGDGFEQVARLAAAAVAAPVMVVIPDLIGTVVASAGTEDDSLASLESWVQERARGRPAVVRDELVAETAITLGERTVGVVGVVGTIESVGAHVYSVLDVAAAAIATAVAIDEARRETEHAVRGSFLEQLRAGEQLSRAEIVRRAGRLGCDLSHGAIVVCVEVDTNRPRLVAATVLDECPGAFAEPVDRGEDQRSPQVWALLPAAAGRSAAGVRSAEAMEDTAKRLAARLRQYGAVGLSRFHEDPTELTRALDEAELMLEVVRRAASPSGDEIVDGTYRLLFRLLASFPDELRSYHAATIAPLVRHDDQYQTDLVRTLEAYLETNCNMNTTAEMIFAHRHTVAHRLERIHELTGFDATSYEDRERLGLGLKIHRLTA
jgi:sugar diacid utilization regulator